VLADGTTVWLNAASSLLYPETFEKEARIVKLEKGEAYFYVTTQTPAQPFIVMIGDKRIQVLGTQFNVEAYDSATVTTTLVEGKVKLMTGGQQKTLQPLQQAVMDANNITLSTGTNLKDVTAWKKGFFTYNDTRLSIIMEDLARWYDVDIDYKDPVKDVSFTISEYPRKDSLGGLLSDLEASKLVHFEVIGKKVIISNKKTK
jgi:ferric-dicitrate binding protein FerR (iron transport regulator)